MKHIELRRRRLRAAGFSGNSTNMEIAFAAIGDPDAARSARSAGIFVPDDEELSFELIDAMKSQADDATTYLQQLDKMEIYLGDKRLPRWRGIQPRWSNRSPSWRTFVASLTSVLAAPAPGAEGIQRSDAPSSLVIYLTPPSTGARGDRESALRLPGTICRPLRGKTNSEPPTPNTPGSGWTPRSAVF